MYVKGGAPLEFSFPRIAACGELHVLALTPMPSAGEDLWRPACTSVTERHTDLRGEELVDFVADFARELGADAILTMSEFAVLMVAHVAEKLGLRGAGSSIVRARDKRLMREAWADAGAPIPAFRRVTGEDDLREGLENLTLPVLLKPAWGAGSVAQLVLNSPDDAAWAWAEVADALEKGGKVGMNELYQPGTDGDLLVEEIIDGTTEGWYPEPGYGDYVSVEGIVADGVYHPLCITGRLPAIPPFTEVASTAPCALPADLQRQIEEVSRQAVDALGLDTCGTHTELKLTENGVMLIETGARFGGVLITQEIETVYGLDVIGMLVKELLGEEVGYPERMLVDGDRAAASLAVIATDAAGNPWRTTPSWNPGAVGWTRLLSPGSAVEESKAFAMPSGNPVPAYDPSGGSRNWLGVFLVTADDAETLRRDCAAVLNGLEGTLNALRGAGAAGGSAAHRLASAP